MTVYFFFRFGSSDFLNKIYYCIILCINIVIFITIFIILYINRSLCNKYINRRDYFINVPYAGTSF